MKTLLFCSFGLMAISASAQTDWEQAGVGMGPQAGMGAQESSAAIAQRIYNDRLAQAAGQVFRTVN